MAKKTAAKGSIDPTPINTNGEALDLSGSNASKQEGTLATDPLPVVKVNKANLGEIKGALDDIVKKHLEEQSFKPSLLHPTVHLSLGYTSIIFSLGSAAYSFKYPFEESKPILWIGVSGYFILQALLWAWKRWVEKSEVFSGRRRRMVKRIETDIMHITSSTSLDPPTPPSVTYSPHTRPSSPGSAPSSPTSLSPSSSDSALHSRDPSTHKSRRTSSTYSSRSSTSVSTASTGPTYSLHLNLSTTSNNGKSLIHKSRVVAGRGIGEFVDQAGGVEHGEVTRWLSGLLVDAGLVGAEEEGLKDE